MIRLLIADDHLMFRQGIRGLLADQEDMQVVAEAANYGEVMNALRSHEFEVAVVDLSMPGRDGIEMITHVKALRPALRILVLTMHHEEQYAARALRAGANGYLTKGSAAEQLVTAIRRLATGGEYVCADVAERLALEYGRNDSADRPHTRLSNREYRVFEMLVAGKTGSEIARELSLSAKTVSTHKMRLLRKMNLRSQTELVRYAIAHGLIGD